MGGEKRRQKILCGKNGSSDGEIGGEQKRVRVREKGSKEAEKGR